MSDLKQQGKKLDFTRVVSVAFVLLSGALSGIVAHAVGVVAAIGVAGGFAVLLLAFFGTVAPRVVARAQEFAAEPVTETRKETISPDRLDPLTGLANENGLMAWLSEKGARIAADGKGIIVVTADLEDFEKIEQTHGKEVSDAVLIEVARRVATCTGSEGIAARTNGDEFAAIATVVPANYAEYAAEQAGKLAELIQRPVELPAGVVWIGGSVGAAAGPVFDGGVILENAREALKKAKRLGRGHYVVHKIMSA
jgi:diguanylate cyclase (GGDEF)-like protein